MTVLFARRNTQVRIIEFDKELICQTSYLFSLVTVALLFVCLRMRVGRLSNFLVTH